MFPADDNTLDSHNKIPTNKKQNNVDTSGWEEYIQRQGSNTNQLVPHVRYGFVDGEDINQGELVPLTDPIPEDATTVSPGIYFLTQEEIVQISRGIPTARIQTGCEMDDRVAYAVVAESDALEDGETVKQLADWLQTLAQDKLNIEKTDYRLFFSGRRSIHLHTDYYVRHENLHRLKETIEEFCQDEGADLDTSIYDPKSQFRLIGTNHRKTDLYKVEVPANADRIEAFRRAQDASELSLPHSIPKGRDDNLVAGNGDRSPLPEKYESRLLWEYLNENNLDIDWDPDVDLDESYTNRYFSPYANTEDGERSICVFEPVGGPYMVIESREIYVPSYIYAATGADGEYTIRQRKAPVLLSKRDYDKWQYEPGDQVVIIGGQSRNSRIFTVDKYDAEAAARTLSLDTDKRDDALHWLKIQEYDIGSSGMHGTRRSGGTSQNEELRQIQSEIERGERKSRRDEVFRISCSLLQIGGWKQAWKFNKEAWGEDFDPEITHDVLSDIVERYPDDYGHIEIPSR